MESLLDFQVEHENPLMRWWRAAVLKNPRQRFRYVVHLAKQKEAERKKESIRVRSFKNERIEVDIAEDEISVIQRLSDSPDSYHTCVDEPDDDGAVLRNEISVSPPPVSNMSVMAQKIEVLELMFLLANFIVELMSIVFDQLSSQHKHKALFLLLCLLMSISAVLISILELIYKLIKEWDFWKRVRSWQCRLYNPPSGVRVGFCPCIIALTCAFGQFIITTVNYSLYRKDGNAPIKVSIWSAIFAFAQLFSYTIFAFVQPKPRAQVCTCALVHVHAPTTARDRVRV